MLDCSIASEMTIYLTATAWLPYIVISIIASAERLNSRRMKWIREHNKQRENKQENSQPPDVNESFDDDAPPNFMLMIY